MSKGKKNSNGPMNVSLEKAKDFKGTVKKLFKYLSMYKKGLIVVGIFSAISSVFAIIGPKILGKATTLIYEGLISKISGSGAGIDFSQLGKILLILMGLYLLSVIFSFVQGFVMSTITSKMTYRLRKDISEKIHRMPLKYFDGQNTGETLSIITNDVDTLSQNLNQSMSQIISSVATMIGVLIMMFSISPLMTIVSLLIFPIATIFLSLIVKKSQIYFKQQQDYLGHTNSLVEEMYGGHTIVKAFNGEQKAINQFEENDDTLYDSAWRSQFLSGMMMPIMTFVGNLGYVVVSILGGWLVVKSKIAVGDILAFTQYIRSFMQPISQVAQITNLLQSTIAAAERVFIFLDSEEEEQSIENAVPITSIEGNIEFKNVNFGYHDDKTIIKNFNAKIKKGQKIAIVGPTGAGKSTMVKLLMRFYDVNGGEVIVDGHNIKEYNRGELRQAFGMVLQDTWLFNDTIMENIRYGNLKATDQEVIEASKTAMVHHFISTLPDAYDMVLNEESDNISEGQKQLLTIARVILEDPKILILDEATSSVDTRTEVLIQESLNKLMENRTSFIIAHRLSTIRNADLILVMNDGDIVEQGNHEDLLKLNGFYANLYKSQFEDI